MALRILLACDKFRNCLKAEEANATVATGLRRTLGPAALDFSHASLADGGEGFAEGIVHATGGQWHAITVEDALGRPVTAKIGTIRQRGRTIAVLEMAEAAGIWRLNPSERDPRQTHTRGVGQLLLAAAGCPLHPTQPPVAESVAEIWVGIGGSATNDAGAGLAHALGCRFFDEAGQEIPPQPQTLANLDKITLPSPFPLPLPPVRVACDVCNPLLGPQGCSHIYAVQKGLPPEEKESADALLTRWAALCPHPAAAHRPGAGAAGGLGFGLINFAAAQPCPGFELFAEATGLLDELRNCDAVITGEGSLDHQSLNGKAPVALARLARSLGKPCFALAGRLDDLPALHAEFTACWSVQSANPQLCRDQLFAQAPELIAKLAETRLAKVLQENL